MIKLLFTRSIDPTHKERLIKTGLDVLEYDFLKTSKLPSANADILTELPHIKNLVFTSQHAVRIFFECLNASQLDFRHFEKKVFSTSGATKDLIEKYALPPTLSADSAKQLAYLMLKKADLTDGVHFICGTLSLPFLLDILTEKEVIVKKLMVYETNLTPLSILEHYNAVIFLSLSAADSFLQVNRLAANTTVFTLGETTTEYVRKMTGSKHVFSAEKPTIAALIDLILLKCT